jgi:hypothetical protein
MKLHTLVSATHTHCNRSDLQRISDIGAFPCASTCETSKNQRHKEDHAYE